MLPAGPFIEPTGRRLFGHAVRSDETFRQEVRREVPTERLLELPDVVTALVVSVRAQSEQMPNESLQIAELTAAVRGQRGDIGDLRRSVYALVYSTGQNRRDIAALIELTAHNSREVAELRRYVENLTRVTRPLADTVGSGFAATSARLDRVDGGTIDIGLGPAS